MRLRPRKIHHIITGLPIGGAQTMLLHLLERLDPFQYQQSVTSLRDLNTLGRRFQELGISANALNMSYGPAAALSTSKLVNHIRKEKPDVVQTWLYHADLVGGIAGRLACQNNIVWNIRHADLNPKTDKRSTILTARTCALLSRWLPQKIICNSETARDIHVELGYPSNKFKIIPNGVDIEKFKPDLASRERMRLELGIGPEQPLIGLIGRFHSQKDHEGFLSSAEIMSRQHDSVRYLFCGENISFKNQQLKDWVYKYHLEDRVSLLGIRNDMPKIMSALDIVAVASSHGEAFPNVLVEAMASGVPCVTTDVGDSRQIVDTTGFSVPPRNPKLMANACLKLLEKIRKNQNHLGRLARQRATEHYSINNVVEMYQKVYESLSRPS